MVMRHNYPHLSGGPANARFLTIMKASLKGYCAEHKGRMEQVAVQTTYFSSTLTRTSEAWWRRLEEFEQL